MALAISTASSSVANAITAAAGPNVSSAMTGMSRVTLTSTVGAYQAGPSSSAFATGQDFRAGCDGGLDLLSEVLGEVGAGQRADLRGLVSGDRR